MRRELLLASLGFALLLGGRLSLCAQDTEKAVSVVVVVVDSSGAPIPRAQVDLAPQAVATPKNPETNEFGKISFDVLPGKYQLFVKAASFVDLSKIIEVEARADQSLIVTLQVVADARTIVQVCSPCPLIETPVEPIGLLPLPSTRFFSLVQLSQEKIGERRLTKTLVYVNKKYGFRFVLPESWKGYSILVAQWDGSTLDKPTKSLTGPAITIRHPSWTKTNPYQDIPLMVFTHAQWKYVEEGNLSVSAAPFGPDEIGRNSRYVFALPPRFDYSNWTGTAEVDQLLRNHPLQPF